MKIEKMLYKALKGILDQACVNGCPEYTSRNGKTTVKHTPECKAAHKALMKAEEKYIIIDDIKRIIKDR